jgi:hypothetical protein
MSRWEPSQGSQPSRDGLRRAKLASAHAIKMGTLTGSPNPPATGFAEPSSPSAHAIKMGTLTGALPEKGRLPENSGGCPRMIHRKRSARLTERPI